MNSHSTSYTAKTKCIVTNSYADYVTVGMDDNRVEEPP